MQNKNTILVVDDQSINIDFIVTNFKDKYSIKVASNGKMALKVLDKFEIDLVLLDIQMPIMDGYETIKEIKKQDRFKDLPVVFLTAKTDNDSLIKGFELGARDYIRKPFNTKELNVRVNNHLETYKLIKRLELSYKNLEKLLDSQANIVILTNGKELKFANRKFFEFLNFENLEKFKEKHKCICEFFIEDENFFHLKKIEEGANWLDEINLLEDSQRVVLIKNETKELAFSVSINQYDIDTMIVNFTDISETFNQKMILEKKILHDKLTNAYNREFFDQNYKKFISEYSSSNSKLAIAMLDIDHFKLVNDNYGHDIGDQVLIQFVDTLNKNSRKNDILVRWGGEEFIMILKIDEVSNLQKILESLRKSIESCVFNTVGHKTCSIGGTIYLENEDILKTIKRADEAVYKAKELGRNKVVIV